MEEALIFLPKLANPVKI